MMEYSLGAIVLYLIFAPAKYDPAIRMKYWLNGWKWEDD